MQNVIDTHSNMRKHLVQGSELFLSDGSRGLRVKRKKKKRTQQISLQTSPTAEEESFATSISPNSAAGVMGNC